MNTSKLFPDGLRSSWSNEATVTWTATPPLPPTLQVTGAPPVAFGLIQSRDALALVPVGIVAGGTACDPGQMIRDRNGVQGNVVPRSAVTWAGSTRPQVVVAECG